MTKSEFLAGCPFSVASEPANKYEYSAGSQQLFRNYYFHAHVTWMGQYGFRAQGTLLGVPVSTHTSFEELKCIE